MSADRLAYRAPKGTLDVLPPASSRWVELVARFASRARRFGFGLVLTPMFEHREVFERVGTETDVVAKEMYVFTDRGGRDLALRPEGTASVVRAFVEHRPTLPWKVWYVAPNFRAERPQRGRYRQHTQVGVELLGVESPDADVEVVALLDGFYRDLGLRRFRLLLHSMGDAASRDRYRAVLAEYLADHRDVLGDEAARVEANPLRVLDAKRPEWHDLLTRAPQLGEYLSAESADHFASVQEGLHVLGIEFEIDPRLVRGFDYYTGTVFEFASDALDAAQNAIGGGGRFDGLAEAMGGPPTPGLGFGAGVERILLACDAEDVLPGDEHPLDVFVVDLVGGVAATVLLAELRAAGLAGDRAYGSRSVRKQWSAADRSGARWGVMLAPRELEAGRVVVKDMAAGAQVEVRRDEVAAWLQTRRESGPT